MSEEEKKAIEVLNNIEYKDVHSDKFYDNRDIVLNLVHKQQKEIQQLKYSITKATKIIDEYANETEKDTKKLIEYQEKF